MIKIHLPSVWAVIQETITFAVELAIRWPR